MLVRKTCFAHFFNKIALALNRSSSTASCENAGGQMRIEISNERPEYR
jgi:hypothetical protein